MTPLRLEILIHYCVTIGVDYDPPRLDAPAVKDAIEDFLELGILKKNTSKEYKCKYVPDYNALHVYIKELCKIPLPILRWIIPQEATE